MSSLTRGTETSFRGGCCCRREFLAPSSVERVTSRFESWGRSGPIPLGGAVETGAGRLPFRTIIHVAGISMFWRSSERAIRGCVRNALGIAQKQGYRSIAFPLIGAGTGGFSPDRALEIMQDEARQTNYDGEVRFVRYNRLT